MITQIEIQKPLTESEIELKLKSRQYIANCFYAITMLVFTGICGYSLYLTPDISITKYMAIAVSFLILAVAMYVMISSLSGVGDYMPMRAEYCSELLELCKNYPAIEEYRTEVATMNRQFIDKEYFYLRRLSLDLKRQDKEIMILEQCKKLYEV